MTDHPEYTLSRPPSCPRNQDHLKEQEDRAYRRGPPSGTIARSEHQASLPNSRAVLSTLNESGMEIGT